jgi:hypothetical protein
VISAETISRTLGGKPSGGGFICLCPAHADTNRSLKVTDNPNGGFPLLYCHGGCSWEAITQALGREGVWPLNDNGNGSGMKIKATYDYLDEQGNLAFQVCRLDPKSFRQRRPDGAGGWVWNMKGVKKVPYRLPQVLQADTVYIAEGEKDCDNLAGLGVTATTNPGGAGKFPAEFGLFFKDKSVVILPDNDEPGRAHAQDVARKLHGAAKSIKIVELPGLPDKGDVSDWLKAGGDMKELKKLVKTTPEFNQSLHDPSLLKHDNYRGDVVTQVEAALKAGNIEPEVITQLLNIIAKPESDKTLAKEIREWVLTTNGYFLTTDVYRELHLTTRDNKKKAVVYLLRLVKEGLMEKCGERQGCYRLVDKEAEEIRWWEADTELPFKLEMPFDLHKQVKVLPKNVIVCAGATNAGKTAFLLNAARLNVDHAPVNYLFLEADGGELKERLGKFQEVGLCSLDTWRKVHFRERSANFHQVIDPDGINIVDYLEMTGDFYRVGEEINAISKRLDKGVAFIGLQKKPGEDYGVGGHYSAFRSRLYLSMDEGRVKVVKAKIGLGNQKLKDRVFRFDLVQGSKFIMKD